MSVTWPFNSALAIPARAPLTHHPPYIHMIYITQLIYVKPGQEAVFDAFENIAIPIISNYNGKLLFRIRPQKSAVIEATIEAPYEIHLVSFQTEEDFERFKSDEERKKYLHLKEQSIRLVTLIKGKEI